MSSVTGSAGPPTAGHRREAGRADEHRRALRCLIADRSPIFALGLETALASEHVTIVGRVGEPAAVTEFLRSEPVDVVLSCFEPPSDAVNVARIVDSCPVLILSSVTTDDVLIEAIRAGARGVLAKEAAKEEVLAALSRVVEGDFVLPSAWEHRVPRIVGAPDRRQDERQRLTRREKEVMEKLVQGYSNKQVALELGIAEQTVKNHVRHIMAKVGVSSRVQLCRWALQPGATLPFGALGRERQPEGDAPD